MNLTRCYVLLSGEFIGSSSDSIQWLGYTCCMCMFWFRPLARGFWGPQFNPPTLCKQPIVAFQLGSCKISFNFNAPSLPLLSSLFESVHMEMHFVCGWLPSSPSSLSSSSLLPIVFVSFRLELTTNSLRMKGHFPSF